MSSEKRLDGDYRMLTDNLPTLMNEICSKYAGHVPLEVLEAYCRRYLRYFHLHVEQQPSRFYGAWGWSEARRREFRRAFDVSRQQGWGR